MARIPMDNPEAVMADFAEKMMRLRAAVIRALRVAAEEGVNAARHNGNYTDHTGSLRSSVGYVLVEDGRVIDAGGFQPVQPKQGYKSTEDGTKVGREYAESLAHNYPDGVTLIMVAGMKYAAHVVKLGYDVLDSGTMEAEKTVKRMMQSIKIN